MSGDEQALPATAVDATIERMAALKTADEQLARRTSALRQLHHELAVPKPEVARLLLNALRDSGLSHDQLRNAGVSYESVMKVLRTPQ